MEPESWTQPVDGDSEKKALQRRVKCDDSSISLTELSGKSEVLEKFLRVESEGIKTTYAMCKTCKVVIKYTTESGTSGLQRHSCKAGAQVRISSFGKRKVPATVKSRLADMITRMCTQDVAPSAVVEGQGFIDVAQELLHIGAKYGSSVEVGDILPSACAISHHVEEEYERVRRAMEELQQEIQAEGPVEQDTHGAGCSQSITPVTPLSERSVAPVTPLSERARRKGPQPDMSEVQKTILRSLESPEDYDELYFRSLVGSFKRLSLQKKAQVRMKIERLLYEAEFES